MQLSKNVRRALSWNGRQLVLESTPCEKSGFRAPFYVRLGYVDADEPRFSRRFDDLKLAENFFARIKGYVDYGAFRASTFYNRGDIHRPKSNYAHISTFGRF